MKMYSFLFLKKNVIKKLMKKVYFIFALSININKILHSLIQPAHV